MEQITRYYAKRIRTKTVRGNQPAGETQYIRQDDFDKLFKVSQSIDDATAFETVVKVNGVVGRLNAINETLDQEWYYYAVQRNETTRRFIDNAPDEVKDLFNDDTDEEEEPEEEPTE